MRVRPLTAYVFAECKELTAPSDPTSMSIAATIVWHTGEHKEVWGDESQGPAVNYRDDAVAQASRAGGQSRIVCNADRRHRASHGMAARRQPDGVAAGSGPRKFYAPRAAWRDPDRDGLGSHPSLSVFAASCAVRVAT